MTPALRDLPWAQKANIKTGADYLKAWVACAFREPFEQLPYIFLWGNQDSGKSIFHEALSVLVTRGGVVQADKVLTAEFNGELAGAIICAVEEKDISLTPVHTPASSCTPPPRPSLSGRCGGTSTKSPTPRTGFRLPTPAAQCPVETGDTRITVIEVIDLLPEQLIPKKAMLIKLQGGTRTSCARCWTCHFRRSSTGSGCRSL